MQDNAEIEMGFRVPRPQRYRLAIGCRRLVEPALHLKQHTQIVVSFGVITSRRNGGPMRAHRLFEFALLLEGIAESQKCFGVIGI